MLLSKLSIYILTHRAFTGFFVANVTHLYRFCWQACWALQHFVNTKFKDMANLGTAVELTRQCLCDDTELPVKVEAAIALQTLIEYHDAAYQYIQPNIKQILLGEKSHVCVLR